LARLALTGGSGAGLGWLVAYALRRRVERADSLEAEKERTHEATLTALVTEVRAMAGRVDRLVDSSVQTARAQEKLEERLNGIGTHYGHRMRIVEQRLARVEARLGDRRRPAVEDEAPDEEGA
jgi:hypothetical protein